MFAFPAFCGDAKIEQLLLTTNKFSTKIAFLAALDGFQGYYGILERLTFGQTMAIYAER